MLTDFPETRDSLIAQIRDPANQDAWEQFVQIYRPIIRRIAIKRGLQPADAQDLSPQALISVAGEIGRNKKSSANTRFRHWLRRVARNALINALSRKPADIATGGFAVLKLLDEVCKPDEAMVKLTAFQYRRELYQCTHFGSHTRSYSRISFAVATATSSFASVIKSLLHNEKIDRNDLKECHPPPR